jgi:hypothetical protein
MNDLTVFGLSSAEYQEAYRALRRGETEAWERVCAKVRPAYERASATTRAVMAAVMAALKASA